MDVLLDFKDINPPPKDQQRVLDRLGSTWCFEHGEPNSYSMPCAECAKICDQCYGSGTVHSKGWPDRTCRKCGGSGKRP